MSVAKRLFAGVTLTVGCSALWSGAILVAAPGQGLAYQMPRPHGDAVSVDLSALDALTPLQPLITAAVPVIAADALEGAVRIGFSDGVSDGVVATPSPAPAPKRLDAVAEAALALRSSAPRGSSRVPEFPDRIVLRTPPPPLTLPASAAAPERLALRPEESTPPSPPAAAPVVPAVNRGAVTTLALASVPSASDSATLAFAPGSPLGLSSSKAMLAFVYSLDRPVDRSAATAASGGESGAASPPTAAAPTAPASELLPISPVRAPVAPVAAAAPVEVPAPRRLLPPRTESNLQIWRSLPDPDAAGAASPVATTGSAATSALRLSRLTRGDGAAADAVPPPLRERPDPAFAAAAALASDSRAGRDSSDDTSPTALLAAPSGGDGDILAEAASTLQRLETAGWPVLPPADQKASRAVAAS